MTWPVMSRLIVPLLGACTQVRDVAGIESPRVRFVASVSIGNEASAPCPGGYRVMSGGCSCDGPYSAIKTTVPHNADNAWVCVCVDNEEAPVMANAVCVDI